MTLRLFAEVLDLSAPYVSELENGTRYPHDNPKLIKMIEILNLSPEEQETLCDLAGKGRNEVAMVLP